MDTARINAEIIRRMINSQIEDLVLQTKKNIDSAAVSSLEDVRKHDNLLVSFSSETKENVRELKKFLMHRLYKNPKVKTLTDVAEIVVKDLFNVLHREYHSSEKSPTKRLRSVADEIASLTDSSAVKMHAKFFPDKNLWPHPLFNLK